ncbi:bud neck involved protein [Gnomoniopsis smithogilvyi]|uniref:Bud neck involved protein n=1 Tax=Gnomoniopsis smithogilvyi TaxID=1191159 RepID=A0A9W8YU90_9PEZI|nr:bud neck involved protein [Gnomoniopsis smithogilvyi]
MLQSRNGSGPTMMPPQPQQNQQYGVSQQQPQQQQRNYHAVPVGNNAPMSYRGSAAPIQPYAFTSTPNLNTTSQRQAHPNFRASSSSAVPTTHTFVDQNGYPRSRHNANASLPNLPMNMAPGGTRDDSSIPSPMARRGSGTPRPQSAYFSSSTVQTSFAPAAPAKSQPDRYRRASQRGPDNGSSSQQGQPGGSAPPSGSGMAAVSHLYTPPPSKERRPSPSNLNRPNSFYARVPGTVDDMQLGRNPDESKRFRRRSMPALDAVEVPKSLAALDLKKPEKSPTDRPSSRGADKDKIKTARLVTTTTSASAKNGSSESLVSSRSSNSRPSSSANRNSVHTPTGNPAQLSHSPDDNSSDSPKLINIPPRGSSSDAAKRVANPSPLSKPVTMEAEGQKGGSSTAAPKSAAVESKPAAAETAASNRTYESPAVKQLAAINQKGGKLKSKTSRLRRALSFGSAAEFKKAGGAGVDGNDVGESSGTPKANDSNDDELDPEQARIAEQQEAAGLGHSIYAGNSKMFAASNDNISISSTASSASIMIRKMGRGMKKGGRSLAGLFRPKSVIGVPPPDIPEGSQATVSMVTVEAERERVNVHAEPNPENGGGTGYPRLERNSIDASNAANGLSQERTGSSGTDNSNSRKSIVGGDRERAEVLAAVRKGILKHKNGSSTPSPKPVEGRPVYELPPVATVSDSPISSAPSTPNDEAGQKRTDSPVTIGNEDYFMTALRLRQDSKSAPGTPSGQSKRNATFSPRLIFYDTWTGQEYDRRSELATCNRLTPMLAQQIKEELNTFKMEMEVHESSKIYTHFF